MSHERKSSIVPAELIGEKNPNGEVVTHPGSKEGHFYMTTRDRNRPNMGRLLRPGRYTIAAFGEDARTLMIGAFALNHSHALRRAQKREQRPHSPKRG